MRRMMSVGLTFPADGRSNNPYLMAELISTAIWPLHPILANFAASRSVHSFPALFSRTACGIRRHLRMGCLGYPRGMPRLVAPLPVLVPCLRLDFFFLPLLSTGPASMATGCAVSSAIYAP